MSDTRKVRVLIVEDNRADADLVIELLERSRESSFEIGVVQRLQDAESWLEQTHADCLLLDLGLPDSQGLEGLIEMRSRDPHLPIVVLTGRADGGLGISALQEGAQDYLVKGNVDGDQIARAIRYAIERKKLDAAKSEFIARAAHELRTPLTVLAGLGEILGARFNDLSEERVQESLEMLRSQGKRARVLINNLLDLSQVEMGRVQINIEEVSVSRAVGRALEAAPPPAQVEVGAELPEDLIVAADPVRLEQVVLNLLTNAYKYGGRTVAVGAAPERTKVHISVSDDGRGVPPELERDLFEPFTRGPNTGNKEGSGLGLAICRKLIEACGGRIWYEPNVPAGARFVIEMNKA